MPVRRAAIAIVSRRPKKLPPASIPVNFAPSPSMYSYDNFVQKIVTRQ
jgi:hypothetical protein